MHALENLSGATAELLLDRRQELVEELERLNRAHATGEIEWPVYYDCRSRVIAVSCSLDVSLVSLAEMQRAKDAVSGALVRPATAIAPV